MPRETPLSAIHLQNMLTLRQAGATILFLAPGFYHGAETVDDLVDFIVGRALDQLGLENALVEAVGRQRELASRHPAGGRGPGDVRPDRARLRRDEPGDDGRARPALAPDRRRGGRPAGRPRARRLLRHRRPGGRRARSAAASSPASTSRRAMLERARRKLPSATWVEGDLLALPFEDGSFEAATVGFGVRNVADLEHGLARAPARARPGRARRRARDHPAARAARSLLPALVRPDRAAARQAPEGRRRLHLPAGERPPLPRPRRARGADARRRLRRRRVPHLRRRDRRAPHGDAA